MGIFDDVGKGLSDAGNWAGNAAKDVGGKLNQFGNWAGENVLGTTRHPVNPYQVDPNAANIAPTSLYGGATINTGAQDATRGQQQSLADMYMAQARGQGPSLAQAQLQRGMDSNFMQALSMASAQHGAGAAGALHQLAMQRGQLGQQMAGDSAILRLNEQMQAQNGLAGLLGGMRSQDLGLASGQAGLDQQAGIFNAGSQNNHALAQQQANMGLQALQSGNYNTAQGLSQADYQAFLARVQGLMNLGGQGASALKGMMGGAGGTAGATGTTALSGLGTATAGMGDVGISSLAALA